MRPREERRSEWVEVKLGDIAFEVNERCDTNGHLPVLSMTKYDGFVPSQEYFGRQVYSRDLSNYKVVRQGQFAYATIHLDEGAIDLLKEYEAGLISPMYTVFTPNLEKVDPFFLQYLLKSDEFITRYGQLGQGSVNRRKSIGFNILSTLRLSIPPRLGQEQIVQVLASVDDVIEATRTVIKQTRRLKTALLQELLTNGLPGRHNKFKIVRHLGRMPVAWDVRTIGEVFEVQLGKMLSQAAKTGKAYRPYVGNWNVQWGRFDLNHVEQMDFTDDEFEKFVLQPGDILVCEGGEVGRTAIWKGEIKSCCYQKALHRLRPRPSVKVIPEFFMYFMEQGTLRSIFLPFTGESSIAHLTRETLVQIPMPLPNYAEQEAIVAVLEGVEARARAEEMKVQQLEKAKAALSQGLLTGRIPVTVTVKEEL